MLTHFGQLIVNFAVLCQEFVHRSLHIFTNSLGFYFLRITVPCAKFRDDFIDNLLHVLSRDDCVKYFVVDEGILESITDVID